MKTFRPILATVIVLWIAGSLQASLQHRLAFLGFRPDFVLVAIVCLSLNMSRAGGTLVGFFGGLVHGAAAGANLAHYVISRTLSGFLASWSLRLGLEMNLITVALTAAAITLIGHSLFMFLAAPNDIAGFLGDTIRSAMYNGVLAMPLYALLKRILNPIAR